ncbi:hypothetical protein VP01_138g2 [Puccinia sorghi]|uniref:Uncharacterized protein n=1 Tax=Puccinia sorghi TaxID=27349 RepID=A0A0L6VL65_9BASI|nr:hypothetical protein VP01_138g2 [Puccinia sorghi]
MGCKTIGHLGSKEFYRTFMRKPSNDTFGLGSVTSIHSSYQKTDGLALSHPCKCYHLQPQKNPAQLPAVDMQHAPAKLPSKLHLFACVDVLAQSLCSLQNDCASKLGGITLGESWEQHQKLHWTFCMSTAVEHFFFQCMLAYSVAFLSSMITCSVDFLSSMLTCICFVTIHLFFCFIYIITYFSFNLILYLGNIYFLRRNEIKIQFKNYSGVGFNYKHLLAKLPTWRFWNLLESWWPLLVCLPNQQTSKNNKKKVYLLILMSGSMLLTNEVEKLFLFNIGFFLLIQSGNWESPVSFNTYKWGVFTMIRICQRRNGKCMGWWINSSNPLMDILLAGKISLWGGKPRKTRPFYIEEGLGSAQRMHILFSVKLLRFSEVPSSTLRSVLYAQSNTLSFLLSTGKYLSRLSSIIIWLSSIIICLSRLSSIIIWFN